VKTVERVTIALLAGKVAKSALAFQEPTSLVDMQIKKLFLNMLIKDVNELKEMVLKTTDLLEGQQL
jgi:hypothetical protein